MTTKNDATKTPKLISESNLSKAWAEAILHIMDHSGKEISPLLISITGCDVSGVASEDTAVRSELDILLNKKGFRNIENVAHTIFPQRIWEISKKDRIQFYRIYLKTFERYRCINKKDNERGSYFERLVNYGRGPNDGNQLEWIISQYRSKDGIRRSMFQASIFDPGRDHRPDPYLQFPCLQHISIVPTQDGLILNAFYATQQLLDKAYGNYLGLSRLGAFIAHEMGMKLIRLNVTIGVAKLERIGKTDPDLSPLTSAISSLCNRHQYSLLV